MLWGFGRGCSALFLQRWAAILLLKRRERAKRATRLRWRCRESAARRVRRRASATTSPSEAVLVRRIFLLQDSGSVADAARETGRLGNDLLLGAILADRYLRSWSARPSSPAGLPGSAISRRPRPSGPAGACGAGHDGGGRRSAADAAACGATGGGLAAPAVRAEPRCRGDGRFAQTHRSDAEGCLSVGWPRCGLASPTLRPGSSTPPSARRRPRRCERRAPSGRDTWHSAAAIVAGSPSGCVAPRRKAARSTG